MEARGLSGKRIIVDNCIWYVCAVNAIKYINYKIVEWYAFGIQL